MCSAKTWKEHYCLCKCNRTEFYWLDRITWPDSVDADILSFWGNVTAHRFAHNVFGVTPHGEITALNCSFGENPFTPKRSICIRAKLLCTSFRYQAHAGLFLGSTWTCEFASLFRQPVAFQRFKRILVSF